MTKKLSISMISWMMVVPTNMVKRYKARHRYTSDKLNRTRCTSRIRRRPTSKTTAKMMRTTKKERKREKTNTTTK